MSTLLPSFSLLRNRVTKRNYSSILAVSIVFLFTLPIGSAFSQSTTLNYNYTGAPVTWVVPDCVTEISIVLDGAQGGGVSGATGGNGANVTATIPVLPGDVIEIIVGGEGGCPTGGYPGGGDGWNSSDGTASYGSCGGGGHTQISVNGILTGVAAGGGGAGGGSDTFNDGGNGGCATGIAGEDTYGDGGEGGTATAGGAGGAPWAGTPPGGYPGGYLFGGDGGPWDTAPGGGGGSGYYGGGGGGNDGCCTGANGGGGGGGGSSLTPGGGACAAGSNAGDGFASITFDDALPPVGGAANVSPDPVCEGDDVTLTLAGWSGVSFQWQSAPGAGGPWSDIAGAVTTPYVFTGITANTCFRAEVTGNCPPNAFSTVACVTVDPLPTTANAGPDQDICGTTATLAGNPAASGTGVWGISSGGSAVTAPTNPASGVTGLTVGANTYTWTISSGVCPPSSDLITITAAFPVNAGADNAISICNTAGSSVDLNTLLGGADPGGIWAETSGSGAFDPGTGVLDTDGLAAGTYTFTYTMTGVLPCPDDVANFTVTVEEEVNAGTDNSTSICNTAGSSVDLNTLLSGADAGGTWLETSASGAFDPGTGVLDTDGLTAGTYTFTYTMTGIAPCTDDVSNFSVTVEQEADAGADNSTTSCNMAGSTVDLNTLLVGADAGGTWLETSASGAFNPTTGILNSDGLTAGAYTFTYTVDATAPCVPDVANFTVTVSAAGNAGADNSTSICNTLGSSVDLNTLLSGADAGGAWLETSGSGAFDPGTGILDTDGLAAGTYTFTYTITPAAPCPIDVADFSVTVEQELVAGTDNSTTLCNSAGSTVDLNSLVSGDAGGTWLETTASGQFNPATGVFDASGLTAGVYSFTYSVNPTAPCVPDDATFDVTVTNMPDAGVDNSTSICNAAGSSVDLNSLLSGADAGGIWAETSASGAFDSGTGVLDTDGLSAGTYSFTYTLPAVGPCPGDIANFDVTVEQEVNAGLDNSTSICNTAGSSVDLNTLLSGADAGGIWLETSASGAFNAATGLLNTDGLTAGTYAFTYTMNAIAPCTDDFSSFTVTVEQEVNAGTDDATSICNLGGSSVDINTLLSGADAGGTFSETTSSGAFTPSTGILNTDGLAAGTYDFLYVLTAISPCLNDTSEFSVSVEQEVIAGADNATAICNTTGSMVDMNTLLSGADAGGTFAETSGSGTFDPGTGILDTDGLAAGAYTFTYTMSGTAPCPDDLADFTVTVEQEAIAGPDNGATMCNSGGSTMDLNTLLVGAAPGVWAETTASGQFTPATGVFDASGLTPGVFTFTYTVAGVAPCPDDVADITVTVTSLPDAGADDLGTQICNISGSMVDLSTMVTGDPGGIWNETTASGAFDPSTGILTTDGLTEGSYNFTYDIAAVGPCPGDQALFSVFVAQEMSAGLDDLSPEICNTAGSSVNLNTSLSGADPGGIWTETTASGAFTAGTAVLNTDGLAAGTYTFTYEVTPTAPCPSDIANFSVTVQEEVNAGADNAIDSCNFSGSIVDVNTLLTGADVGGVWSETSSSGAFSSSTGIFTVSDLTGGDYTFTYTMDGAAPCPDDVATITVSVNEVPVLDPLTNEEVCDQDNLTSQLFSCSTPGTSFDWNNMTGTDVGCGLGGTGVSIGIFTANSGVFVDETVTIEVTPYTAECTGLPLTFDITVHPLPQVGLLPDQVTGCEPFNVQFNSMYPADLGSICTWSFGDGSTSSTCNLVNHQYNYAGTYDVSLEVTTMYGCSDIFEANELIQVYPEAVADFTFSPTSIDVSNTEVDFTNLSENADSFEWNFGDYSPHSTEFDPSHTYPEVGNENYSVTLYAYSAGGCDSWITKEIVVDDIIMFFIPNIFTPDGDQYNETFKPVMASGVDPYDYHLTVFNRWGEIVFESYDYHYGWDGSYGSGGLVEDGTYIWNIEFGETMSDKKHKHHGHVTILK